MNGTEKNDPLLLDCGSSRTGWGHTFQNRLNGGFFSPLTFLSVERVQNEISVFDCWKGVPEETINMSNVKLCITFVIHFSLKGHVAGLYVEKKN